MPTLPLQYEIGASDARLKRVLRGVVAEAKAAGKAMDTALVPRRVKSANRAVATRDIEAQAKRTDARIQAFKLRQLRTETRHRKSAIRELEQQEKASIRRVEAMRKARQRTTDRVVRGAGRTVGSMGRVLTGAGSLVAGGAAIMGGLAVGGAVQETIAVNAASSRLANQAGNPALKKVIAREATSLRGFSGMEAVAGLEAFVDITGDLDAGRSALQDLARLALATGTNLDELAAAAGSAFIPLSDQISDPQERLEALKDVMATIAAQGAIGAVEIKDLAKEMAGLSATAARFAGDPRDTLGVMGAIAQASRQRGGSESAAEAVTSVARFSSDTIKKQGALKRMGVNVFADEGKTQLRDPRQIIGDVLSATGGDLTKLTSVFGERSIRAVGGFAPVFTQAERQKKGSGRAAVEKEFDRLLRVQLTDEQVNERSTSRLADDDIRIKEAMRDFNREVGTKLLPVVSQQLIPALTKLTPVFANVAEGGADLADWFSTNPLQGIGAVIAGKVALDIASAGVGKAAEMALSKAMQTMPTATLATAIGVAIAGAMVVAGENAASETTDPQMRAIRTMRELDSGQLMDPAEMIKRRVSLQGDLDKLKEGPSVGAKFFGGISGVLGGPDADETNQAATSTVQQALDELNSQLGSVDTETMQASLNQATEFMGRLAMATQTATSELEKVRGDMPNRRNSPIIAR